MSSHEIFCANFFEIISSVRHRQPRPRSTAPRAVRPPASHPITAWPPTIVSDLVGFCLMGVCLSVTIRGRHRGRCSRHQPVTPATQWSRRRWWLVTEGLLARRWTFLLTLALVKPSKGPSRNYVNQGLRGGGGKKLMGGGGGKLMPNIAGRGLKPKVWPFLVEWLTGGGEGSGLLISDADVIFGRPLKSIIHVSLQHLEIQYLVNLFLTKIPINFSIKLTDIEFFLFFTEWGNWSHSFI